jgi:hypothetical protein
MERRHAPNEFVRIRRVQRVGGHRFLVVQHGEDGPMRTAAGVYHVTPPLVDVLTCTELTPPKAGPSALKARRAW